ncbi:hypothetical protein GCM10009854_24260 [Saccharopolyspora halophila]|uniref:Tyr recombinase domain-containing protein n=1 Tax=Saccharopolyspora halophila TaxID=405551 RepID=A0ABN3G8H3_9PSEU
MTAGRGDRSSQIRQSRVCIRRRPGVLRSSCSVLRFREFWASLADALGERHREAHPTEAKVVQAIAKNAAGGLNFHDLRHSYAT